MSPGSFWRSGLRDQVKAHVWGPSGPQSPGNRERYSRDISLRIRVKSQELRCLLGEGELESGINRRGEDLGYPEGN